MKQVTLIAQKMSCGHCKMAIENAGSALAGVSSISADPESKKVDVSYDESAVDLDTIRKAIEEAGYPTEL